MSADPFTMVMIAVSIVVIVLGFPIAYAMLLCSMIYILVNGLPISLMVHELALSLNSFTMISVPLFMFAGKLMTASGISDRIFDFTNNLVGRVPGGLGHVNVASSLVFAGMSGSTLADVAGLGEIEYKAMTRKGYDADFTIGVTLSSAAIGPILPPSLPMVLYGVTAGVSISGLFLGGILPGFLIAASLMVYVFFVGLRRGYRVDVWAGWRALGISFLRAAPPLFTPFIIVGGMAFGWFSPTEAATVSVLYGLFIATVVYRSLSFPAFLEVLRDVTLSASRLLFVIATAFLFGWVATFGEVPQMLAALIEAHIESVALFLLVCIIVNLILGAILENAIPLLVLAPMLAPIAEQQYGLDPVHFGVVMVFNIMIGQFTPPIGLSLFVMRDITGFSVTRIFRAVLPFLAPLIISLFLMAYFPWIVTAIPRAAGF
ncbi:TRAP transporter large permease [Pelagibius litoralis]|uniref:TRAP transporter large permease protein n=1 Tax=Pelagibius litoralis TaxID=374515 RepID=A0A967EVQ6_9PROT|nr:TRAP transporter large permease [Pelagibius litoralis]NIA68882.1 TRAP transporter large permease [Pelagibius litoralis]